VINVAGKDVAFSAPAKRFYIGYGLQPAVFSFRTDCKDTLIKVSSKLNDIKGFISRI